MIRAHFCCAVLSEGVIQCKNTKALLRLDDAVARAWRNLCAVCDQFVFACTPFISGSKCALQVRCFDIVSA